MLKAFFYLLVIWSLIAGVSYGLGRYMRWWWSGLIWIGLIVSILLIFSIQIDYESVGAPPGEQRLGRPILFIVVAPSLLASLIAGGIGMLHRKRERRDGGGRNERTPVVETR